MPLGICRWLPPSNRRSISRITSPSCSVGPSISHSFNNLCHFPFSLCNSGFDLSIAKRGSAFPPDREPNRVCRCHDMVISCRQCVYIGGMLVYFACINMLNFSHAACAGANEEEQHEI